MYSFVLHLPLILIVTTLSLTKSQQIFYENVDSNNIRESKPYNEKIYFPGKTNEDETNTKRLNSGLTNSFINEQNSNHIDTEAETRNQNSAFRRRIAHLREDIAGLNSNTINNHRSSYSLSEESGERRTASVLPFSSSSMNRRNLTENSTKDMKKIPPPSLVDTLQSSSKLRVCEKKYAAYIQRIFPQESDTASDANDAEFNGRVLAAPGQYPHMTALGFLSKNGRIDYKCGGSLISENFVITAAHCTNLTGLQPTKVRIGDLNLMVEESYLEPQIRDTKTIYVHPEYRTNSYYNDIALLELAEEIELTEFVRPIRLWTKSTIPITTAHAMGYGATDFARLRTNRLTNLNMTIVPNDECNREIPNLPQTDKGIISSQICSVDYELNRDTCQGDSGGPLQLNIRGRRRQNRLHYQLIGITSYGLYCRSGYPSIYTRVYSYLDWIEHIVWRDHLI